MNRLTTYKPTLRFLAELELWGLSVDSILRKFGSQAAMAITQLFNRWGMERAALKWAYRAARLREDWAEPWVAMGALYSFLDQREAAFEALIGANARDPSSRVIMLMIAKTLDSIEMCESAYEWHCEAAHASWKTPRGANDGHSDAMFWCELGIYCLEHDRFDEAQVAATYATLHSLRGG